MAYTPTEWKTGDVITAEKLNNMEDGIAGAGGITIYDFTVDGVTVTSTATPSEVLDAVKLGGLCIARVVNGPEVNGFIISSYATFVVSFESLTANVTNNTLNFTKLRIEGQVTGSTWTYSRTAYTVPLQS